MPRQDRTGPQGLGAKTGRQMGNCEGATPIVGRGRGFGPCGCGMRRGFGRGYGFRGPISLTDDQEKKILEAELQEMDLEKQEIEKRLKELK